jgi:hypothetical protein
MILHANYPYFLNSLSTSFLLVYYSLILVTSKLLTLW